MTRKCIRPEHSGDGSCQFENAVGLKCEDRGAPGGATPPGRPAPISPAQPGRVGGASAPRPRLRNPAAAGVQPIREAGLPPARPITGGQEVNWVGAGSWDMESPAQRVRRWWSR